jgi:hypothetical protein
MESLPAIDARTMAKRGMFPRNHIDRHEYADGYIAAGVARLVVSRRQVEILHGGKVQSVSVDWLRGGFGYRPGFVCSCGRRAYKLRQLGRSFCCKHCCGLPYLSQAVSSTARPIVQAMRLKRFLSRWDRPLHWRSFHRISGLHKSYAARIPRRWRSRQIADHLLAPLIRYGARVATHRG